MVDIAQAGANAFRRSGETLTASLECKAKRRIESFVEELRAYTSHDRTEHRGVQIHDWRSMFGEWANRVTRKENYFQPPMQIGKKMLAKNRKKNKTNRKQ